MNYDLFCECGHAIVTHHFSRGPCKTCTCPKFMSILMWAISVDNERYRAGFPNEVLFRQWNKRSYDDVWR